jgi:hypothetical protein
VNGTKAIGREIGTKALEYIISTVPNVIENALTHESTIFQQFLFSNSSIQFEKFECTRKRGSVLGKGGEEGGEEN